MTTNCDVVVSGMGVVSPIGIGIDPFWKSLTDGVSGVRIRPEFADTTMPYRIAADVLDFNAKEYVRPRKSLKVMCSPIQYGFAAAQMAVEHANLVDSGIDPDRIGVVFGAETFFADPEDVENVFFRCIVDGKYQHNRWGEFAMREIMPLWMLKYLPNMVASHISIAQDARGPNNTICQAELSSQLATIEGINLIQRGAADVVIVGGTGSTMETTALVYRGSYALTQNVADPVTASRPFDANRDGMVVGAGAAALVLESAEHAAARGQKTLARFRGYNRQFQNYDSEDFSKGIGSSITLALEQAGLAREDIAHVNANGLSTIRDDELEAAAIADVLGDTHVFAAKSYFGNIGPGTSTMEMIASIQALNERRLPPTLNFEQPDPACPVNVADRAILLDDTRAFAKIGFANTGQIATIIATLN